MCIEKEDASVKLYAEMAAMVKDADSRQILLSLAEEEMRHKIKFEVEYDNPDFNLKRNAPLFLTAR